ncbi:hypothetical protein P5E90_11785 [Clostridium perfringens]|uniref:hypothetical protein n=1 Tax=Clostridium perfringens TaxID=1502 RepID=UPI0013E314CA|nr:hypothetical protein [Clostridium perfringens]MDK0621513.1 hypothetical protein [Clostridium perfringens]NGS95730.1 hypothetical protein [Clostridium perfringens]
MRVKCELDICKNNKEGICNLKEITIQKYYDSEYGFFNGGECFNYSPKQSFLDEKSERTFKLMKISEDTYYAVRRDVYDDVDVKYMLRKYPNMKTLIVDNLIRLGSSIDKNRFYIFSIKDGNFKFNKICAKNDELITKDMLKFTCDYIREIPNKFDFVGCLTSTVYKMIKKGIDL